MARMQTRLITAADLILQLGANISKEQLTT
jgi:hypothetical protein